MSNDGRDVEKVYETADMVDKLRRLADALETGKRFRISVAGQQINVPARAQFSIEHERDADHEELEFQFSWTHEDNDEDDDGEPS